MRTIIISFIIILTGLFILSIHNDKVRDEFWDEQMSICGRAGFVHDKDSNECTPVDYLK